MINAAAIRILIDGHVYALDDGALMRAPVHLDGYVPDVVRDVHEWHEVDDTGSDRDGESALAGLIAAYLEFRDTDPHTHEPGRMKS